MVRFTSDDTTDGQQASAMASIFNPSDSFVSSGSLQLSTLEELLHRPLGVVGQSRVLICRNGALGIIAGKYEEGFFIIPFGPRDRTLKCLTTVCRELE